MYETRVELTAHALCGTMTGSTTLNPKALNPKPIITRTQTNPTVYAQHKGTSSAHEP